MDEAKNGLQEEHRHNGSSQDEVRLRAVRLVRSSAVIHPEREASEDEGEGEELGGGVEDDEGGESEDAHTEGTKGQEDKEAE